MTIGIIGLGLIGGSMAIDLKRRGFATRVLGVEAEPFHAEAALKMQLCDEIVPYEECLERSDIVVVAVPVGTAVKMAWGQSPGSPRRPPAPLWRALPTGGHPLQTCTLGTTLGTRPVLNSHWPQRPLAPGALGTDSGQS